MPPAIGAAIVGVLGLTGTVATVATFAISAGLTIAGTAAANALFGKKPPEFSSAQRDRTHVVRSSVAPMRVVYGAAKVSGPLVAAFSSGDDNKYLHLVIPLAGHEVQAITALFVDDEEVATAAGTAGWRLPASGRLVKTGADGVSTPGFIQWKLLLGAAGQAADPHLMAAAPSGQWTADHRLRGIAYLYAQLEWDPEKWTSIPNLAATVRGRKVFDPRTGATAWSSNPALCIRDYLLADFGLNCDASEIDDVSFIVAANLCDEQTALTSTTTQTRYTLDGVIFLDAQPLTIMEQMLSSCAGTLVYTGGKYRLFAGGYFAPALTLTSDDLRGPIKVRPRLPRSELFNGVKGTFIDPDKYWQPTDFPAVRNTTYEAEDGEAILRDVEFPFTTDSVRAQRLARIMLERARQGITVEFPATLAALRVAVMEPVRLTIPELGWTNKEFVPVGWSLTADGGIDLTLREEAAAVYDWNHGHATTYDVAANTVLRTPFTVAPPSAVTVTPFAELQPDGTTVPALRVAWTAARDAFVTRYEIQSRGGAAAAWDSRLVPAGTTEVAISPVVSGRTYDVRARSLNTIGAASVWVTPSAGVAPADTTPPAAPTGLTATGDMTQITLAWTNPPDSDLRHIEVWGAAPLAGGAVPAVTDATRLAVVQASTWVHTGLGGVVTRYYWVRGVDRTGNVGPWHGALGVSATTRLVRYSDMEQRFIDTSLLADSLSAQVLSVNSLANSYTNLALEISTTNTAVATVRSDVAALTTASSSFASWVSTVESVLGPRAATVQATMTAVDGIRAGYMLKTQVESGGRRYVSGFGLATEVSGTAPVSEFMVLANRFAVGTPSVDGGRPQFPFVIVTDAAGTPKVCMESAFIQDATIDTAHIRAAAIDTLRVAGEAITVARAITELTPATLHVFANPLQTVTDTRVFASLTVTVATTGAPVVLQWSAVNARVVARGSSHTYAVNEGWLKLRRNGTAIYTVGERQTGTADGNAGFTYDFPAALAIVDHPPTAGTVTYDIYGYAKAYVASNDTAETTISMDQRSLICLMLLR